MVRKPNKDDLKSIFVATAGSVLPIDKSPDETFGELFHDVQAGRLYGDGKHFADLVPRGRAKQIKKEYALQKKDPNFDLRDFISRHFYEYIPSERQVYVTDATMTVSEHIRTLWSVLETTNRRDRGSLFAVPNPYIIPGGRFREQFYWDSYFVMLGLAVEGKWGVIEGMIKNYTHMIRKFGFIPTANRTYFLSRSQPPFFSHMLQLLARHRGKKVLVEYLPYMLLEYRFWMKGYTKLKKQEHRAFARVVEMPDGIFLNRYYDNKKAPRPESLYEDQLTASSSKREMDRLFLHLRAGAESGWDFSSRWFMDPDDIATIHTADIIPVDLNSLLHHLESTIAESYRMVKQIRLASRFQHAADRRAKAIDKYCWDEEQGFYQDFNFHHQEMTGCLTIAGVFPLYAKIATSEQASRVAQKIETDFLKEGGVVTTLVETGQQWDAPNGWAPLQWITIQGLRNYGYHQLAEEIKRRWIKTNVKVFQEKHKLVEKYNVEDGDQLGGGGEYPLQDGFGWTNGVLAALLAED